MKCIYDTRNSEFLIGQCDVTIEKLIFPIVYSIFFEYSKFSKTYMFKEVLCTNDTDTRLSHLRPK